MMVQIHPFRALRYNPQLIGELSCVIAPPYDVIDAQEQERLYHASPYNIVRLILGKSSPSDTETENRYTRARRDYDAWCAQGVLQRDAAPAVYLIEHVFTAEGRPSARLGFVALLGLDEPVQRSVYRHETTLAAPKADRTQLLQAVAANLSPIFCIYPDDGGTVHGVVAQWMTRTAPAAQATLNGEIVRVWMVTDRECIQSVMQRLASTGVLIADGHHRFEVALAHRDRYGAVMTYFVSMADPALIMRPIHRVLRSQPPVDRQVLERLCTLEPASDLAGMTRWLDGDKDPAGRFGYYDGRRLFKVQLRGEPLAQWLQAPTVPPALASLDVSLLHGLMLPRLDGHSAIVRYTCLATEAVQAVDQGEGTGAWLLRRIPLPQVYALAAQGLTLPPKSTYFYPKVLSGLTINPFT